MSVDLPRPLRESFFVDSFVRSARITLNPGVKVNLAERRLVRPHPHEGRLGGQEVGRRRAALVLTAGS